MNEQERVIRRLFDAIDAGDLAAFREIFTDDVYYERPQVSVLHGVEAMIRFYRDERPIASGQHLTEHVVANAECGAAWGRYRGITRTGAPIDDYWSDVYEFDARGRIRKRRGYWFGGIKQ